MIKPYFETGAGKLYHGDCSYVINEIKDDSVDLLMTDSPYGYSFMGKDWDKSVVSVDKWRECLRILKPGAFAFIMSAPRQDVLSRMIVNLQDAGFETGFTSIYWSYATGFPKAGNTSKFVDKRLGAEREVVGKKKDISHIERKDTNIAEQIHYRPDGWCTSEDNGLITAPSSPKAKVLDGSYLGYQPKPAVEIILVVMKPLSEKSYTDQAMKNGKGITWLDNCRIPIPKNDRHEYGINGDESNPTVNDYGKRKRILYEQNSQGRFPANLLVSDDILNDGLPQNANSLRKEKGSKSAFFGNANGKIGQGGYHDLGSFSRYFDLDKWWEERLKELPPSARKTFPFLVIPKASKSEKNEGCESLEETKRKIRWKGGKGDDWDNIEMTMKNNHPTVKPLKLFSYLITLGSRADDLIIDPFIGSGTMAVACENMNRKWIGIDLNEEYCEIAIERIKKETAQYRFA